MMEGKIAELRIWKASKMTRKERKEVSDWLKGQAAGLIREGDNYSDRFKATFTRVFTVGSSGTGINEDGLWS